jgi:predicted enzyme related to lactoylglutathione lyase
MKLLCGLFLVLALIVISVPSYLAALQQSAPAAQKENAPKKAADEPAKKRNTMRQPGFLFLELDCHELSSHIDFFKAVAGFEVNQKDGNFVTLHSERGEILLNGVGGKAKEKPDRYQGPRVEIGIVVGDLDKAFAEAKKQTGWKIAAAIAKQSWGVRDFRVYSPEGYYIRVTEGPK